MRRLLLAAPLLLSSAPLRAQDGGDTVTEIEAAIAERSPEERSRLDAALKKAEKRLKAEKEQPTEKGAAAPPDPEDVQTLLQRLPEGPAFLDDLKEELAFERAQIVEDNIRKIIEFKSDGAIGGLIRTFLRMVYYDGNNSTDMGPFIKRVLETPNGWTLMPFSRYKHLPRNVAGMATVGGIGSGDLMIDPIKGNNATTYSHEMYHILGHPDLGPDGAYALMGREFGGGGIGDGFAGLTTVSGVSFTPLQCGI